jgi:L-iditol 2-dehydrogenase
MIPATMRAARLHGVRDLRVETVDVPTPGPGELLVRIEACGICPTDVRKFLLGAEDGTYPFNPGHEWVGRVEAGGPDLADVKTGMRVYGDTYAGYAEYALLAVEPAPWSYGALSLPEELPLERAIFVEPLADCLHAVRDQARVEPGDLVVVLGAGQMGLQIVLAAAAAGGRVLAVEPLSERRRLAVELGAQEAVGEEEWPSAARGAAVIILTVGDVDLVRPALDVAGPGARVVLFAGFGKRADAVLDLDRLHYQEIALVGSEWIGTPPRERRERYEEALELLASGAAPLERLVTARCGLDGIAAAYEAQQERRGLKTVVLP